MTPRLSRTLSPKRGPRGLFLDLRDLILDAGKTLLHLLDGFGQAEKPSIEVELFGVFLRVAEELKVFGKAGFGSLNVGHVFFLSSPAEE